MALVKCRECGAQVSTKAEACPQCGAKRGKPTSLFTWIVGGLFAAFVFSCTLMSTESQQRREAQAAATPAPSPADIAAKEQKEREFQMVAGGAMRLRDSMKKPEAFKLESATMIDGKVICYQYTSRNSFNDQRREHYVMSDAVSSGDAKHWNRLCAGKSGTDYTYVRSALP